MNSVRSRFLGLISYDEGLRAQEEAASRLSTNHDLGEILGLEHKAVITLGKRGRVEDDLQITEEEIKALGIELHISPRGGQATLHSPGQLVIYPCMSLTRLGLGVRDYVQLLEKTTQSFLRELGIESIPDPEEPGLYTERGKIAFFGIRVSRGITSHGIAINVANDLTLFNLIRSCGKDGEKFDQIKRVSDRPATTSELFAQWIRHFQ